MKSDPGHDVFLHLKAAFFFGTLSVFDREIERWSIPASRFVLRPMSSFDEMLRPVFESIQPNEESWGAFTTHRNPVLSMFAWWETLNANVLDFVFGYRTIDPRFGKISPDEQLMIGSEFFFQCITTPQLQHQLQRERSWSLDRRLRRGG